MTKIHTGCRGARSLRSMLATICFGGAFVFACPHPAQAQSKDAIVLGAAGPQSGPNAVLGAVFDGMNAVFKTVNAAGGVDGRPIKFEVRDDQFNPANTPGVTRDLVETANVAMICGTTGSRNNAAVKDYLAARGVPAIPTSGSDTLLNANTFEVIATYSQLGAAIAAFAVNEKKLTKIANLYSPDATGQPVADAVAKYLEGKGMKIVASQEFDPSATNFAAQLAAIKASGAEMVITNGIAPVLARLMNAGKQIGYEPLWGSTFATGNTSLVELTNGSVKGRAFFSTPFQLSSANEAKAYRDAMAKYYPKTALDDPLVMQGWTVAIGCVESLKAASRVAGSGPITRKLLIETMNTLKIDNDFIKGVQWTPTDHTGAKEAQIIFINDKGVFERALDFKKF